MNERIAAIKGGHDHRSLDRRGYAWVRLVMERELRDDLVAIADILDITLSEVVRRACRMLIEKP